jgi:hypothetical protein
VISTVDRQARHTRKSKSARRDGFRAHAAAEPDSALITGCELTMATGDGSSDAENGVKLAAADRFGSAGQEQCAGLEVYGDSRYGSGQARADYAAAGHDTVIKPIPLRPAVPGGFTLDDFAVSDDGATVTCPAGHVRPVSAKRYASFGPVCAACPHHRRVLQVRRGRRASRSLPGGSCPPPSPGLRVSCHRAGPQPARCAAGGCRARRSR